MNKEDCYFFIDANENIPELEKTVSTLCVECHDKYYPEIGWFWKGSQEGYGPFTYSCFKCQKIIYQEINE
jgi:hypothetical protein